MFEQNVSLKPFNTFRIDVKAERVARVETLAQLQAIIAREKDVFILSGGSNILLTKDLTKPVIRLETKGIEILDQTETHAIVQAQAGENWHDFVQCCIAHDLGGLENLSLIPGNTGTGPMQNIGAYGTELKDHFYELDALEIESNTLKTFSKDDCRFGYRESYFKKEGKGKYIITAVRFKLTVKKHILNTSYGAIQDELDRMGMQNPGIREVADAVIAIRKRKLPDPKEIGNSGSFFKNPVISSAYFKDLKARFPGIPSYPAGSGHIKVPAGWLIDKLGYKGKRFGDAGVHKNQALVLVNYGNATGKDILNLARLIQDDVKKHYGIRLETEVNII